MTCEEHVEKQTELQIKQVEIQERQLVILEALAKVIGASVPATSAPSGS